MFTRRSTLALGLHAIAGEFSPDPNRRVFNVERGDWMELLRVLVGEDYLPFRRFICSVLERTPNLQVIGEASAGIEAVRKAEELQPNLILLDIGLPTLNGIEAARQIRKLSPESKIIFVSQESSADIVKEAFRVGASAYVVKTKAQIDLPAAVDAVLGGRQFVSVGLLGKNFTDVPSASGF